VISPPNVGSQIARHFLSVGCTVLALVSGPIHRMAKVLRTAVV
jgi:hypothetical protein